MVLIFEQVSYFALADWLALLIRIFESGFVDTVAVLDLEVLFL